MKINRHDHSFFTSRLLFMLFRKSVMSIDDASYTRKQRDCWCGNVCEEKWHRRLCRQTTFIACHDQKITGFLSLSDDGYIDLLYVDPDFHRRGVASALYAAAEDCARRASFPVLSTQASRVAAPFFERHGFQVIRQNVVQKRGVDLPNITMHKYLS